MTISFPGKESRQRQSQTAKETKQIPSLRYGMTNKRAGMTNKRAGNNNDRSKCDRLNRARANGVRLNGARANATPGGTQKKNRKPAKASGPHRVEGSSGGYLEAR